MKQAISVLLVAGLLSIALASCSKPSHNLVKRKVFSCINPGQHFTCSWKMRQVAP